MRSLEERAGPARWMRLRDGLEGTFARTGNERYQGALGRSRRGRGCWNGMQDSAGARCKATSSEPICARAEESECTLSNVQWIFRILGRDCHGCPNRASGRRFVGSPPSLRRFPHRPRSPSFSFFFFSRTTLPQDTPKDTLTWPAGSSQTRPPSRCSPSAPPHTWPAASSPPRRPG